MAVSWRYRIAPHEVRAWPQRSIVEALAMGQLVKDQMDELDD